MTITATIPQGVPPTTALPIDGEHTLCTYSYTYKFFVSPFLLALWEKLERTDPIVKYPVRIFTLLGFVPAALVALVEGAVRGFIDFIRGARSNGNSFTGSRVSLLVAFTCVSAFTLDLLKVRAASQRLREISGPQNPEGVQVGGSTRPASIVEETRSTRQQRQAARIAEIRARCATITAETEAQLRALEEQRQSILARQTALQEDIRGILERREAETAAARQELVDRNRARLEAEENLRLAELASQARTAEIQRQLENIHQAQRVRVEDPQQVLAQIDRPETRTAQQLGGIAPQSATTEARATEALAAAARRQAQLPQ